MPALFRLMMPCALALLGACAGSGGRVPDPVHPTLESVRMTGKRICDDPGSSAAVAACPALPAQGPTEWRLSPLYLPSIVDPKRLHANRVAIINVSAPGKTELDVELVRGEGQRNLPLEPVEPDSASGIPGEVAASRQVGVTVIDDGGRRLWIIEVVVSTCADARHLRFFNRAAKDADRSPSLDVTLVRDRAEQACIDQPGVNPAMRPGVGEPVNERTPGGCAGAGGTGRTFLTCETCPSLLPPQAGIFSAGRYCNWDDVLAAYGYAGEAAVKARMCKLSPVGSREACEGQ